MTPGPLSSPLVPDLFQERRGLYLAPIRHHSPACAWALKEMIRALRPARVLIEAPCDLEHHIPLILDAATVPPVAMVSVTRGENRLAAYYPLTDHSPEYVALREADRIGAEVRFIDLPVADKNLDRHEPHTPIAQDEHQFGTGDYVDALCRRLGCRDGFELWDHLFEARLGAGDWRSFFGDCGTYCAGIREATLPEQIAATGDSAREAFMSTCIAQALDDGAGPVVVVIGGFHAPALTNPQQADPVSWSPGQSFLIRYGYGAMDALAGYGAGLPQPGYYDRLWQAAIDAGGPPDWSRSCADIVEGFDSWLAAKGPRIPLPAKVEALRVAAGLAALRGRDGALRHDLMDGLTTALVKGESGHAEVWAERLRSYLRGTKLGDIPIAAGSPPLVEDVRARARKLRFDISDGAERRRKLDIRRKPAQLEASRFLHGLALLEAGFARRDAGPDYVRNVRSELLFEEWAYAWSPSVEGRLTEVSARADSLPEAVLATLFAERARLAQEGHARDLSALVEMFLQGILAGLDDRLLDFLQAISDDIAAFGTFETVALALRRMHQVANARGPLRIPDGVDIRAAEQAAFQRLVYLCDDLPTTRADDIPERLSALRVMNEVLAGDMEQRLDRSRYEAALLRALHGDTPPEIMGAILACCVQSGQVEATVLTDALHGSFSGVALEQSARIGVLRGLLGTAPQLLWQGQGVLAEVDRFLSALDEDDFTALLPHLRLAFAALNPRETDRLAELLGALHGLGGHRFTGSFATLTDRDLQVGLAADAALRAELAADGLSDWIGS